MAICVLYGVKSIPFVGGRVHHLIDSLTSLLRTNRSDLNAFITAIWSGRRNIRPNCTARRAKIALPKNLWAKARPGLESRVECILTAWSLWSCPLVGRPLAPSYPTGAQDTRSAVLAPSDTSWGFSETLLSLECPAPVSCDDAVPAWNGRVPENRPGRR